MIETPMSEEMLATTADAPGVESTDRCQSPCVSIARTAPASVSITRFTGLQKDRGDFLAGKTAQTLPSNTERPPGTSTMMGVRGYVVTRFIGFLALCSAVVAGVTAYLHPTVTYVSYYTVALGSLVTDSCLSPFNKWRGHYQSVVTGPLGRHVEATAVTACKAAIVSREHLVIFFAVLTGFLVFAAAVSELYGSD